MSWPRGHCSAREGSPKARPRGLYCVESVYGLPDHWTADPLVSLIHIIEWNQLKMKIAILHRSIKPQLPTTKPILQQSRDLVWTKPKSLKASPLPCVCVFLGKASKLTMAINQWLSRRDRGKVGGRGQYQQRTLTEGKGETHRPHNLWCTNVCCVCVCLFVSVYTCMYVWVSTCVCQYGSSGHHHPQISPCEFII